MITNCLLVVFSWLACDLKKKFCAGLSIQYLIRNQKQNSAYSHQIMMMMRLYPCMLEHASSSKAEKSSISTSTRKTNTDLCNFPIYCLISFRILRVFRWVSNRLHLNDCIEVLHTYVYLVTTHYWRARRKKCSLLCNDPTGVKPQWTISSKQTTLNILA